MWHELRLFLIALQFMTRVPVPRWVGFEPGWLLDSTRHFPGVGLLVGGVGAATLAAAAHLWPAMVAVLLSMAVTMWMTGAFHEAGLAATADGLGGAFARERSLAIMKDARLGARGTATLVLALALKASVLLALALRDLELVLIALPLAHCWSRGAPLLLARWLRPAEASEPEASPPFAQPPPGGAMAMAAAWAAIAGATASALGVETAALWKAALASLLVAWLARRWLAQRLGGFTGSTLGATQQVCEVMIYLVLLATVSR